MTVVRLPHRTRVHPTPTAPQAESFGSPRAGERLARRRVYLIAASKAHPVALPPVRGSQKTFTALSISVSCGGVTEVIHHRLAHRCGAQSDALLTRQRPRASFARSLLSDRLAQATTSRPHSTSRGIDCSASSRQITRHNALCRTTACTKHARL